jgi:hypothetical protein
MRCLTLYHKEVLRGWKHNSTMMLRGGTFGKRLGLDKFIRVKTL